MQLQSSLLAAVRCKRVRYVMNGIDTIEDTRLYFNSLCLLDEADLQDCVPQTTSLLC